MKGQCDQYLHNLLRGNSFEQICGIASDEGKVKDLLLSLVTFNDQDVRQEAMKCIISKYSRSNKLASMADSVNMVASASSLQAHDLVHR